jgi:hypothetical protein
LIILHTGGNDEWVTGAELVFETRRSTGDYHDEMNSKRYHIRFSNLTKFTDL